jgi:hypothetical protein
VSPVTAELLISGAGFVLSVVCSAFVSGSRWGRVTAQLAELERERVTRSDVSGIGERLAKIEGMFELKLRE